MWWCRTRAIYGLDICVRALHGLDVCVHRSNCIGSDSDILCTGSDSDIPCIGSDSAVLCICSGISAVLWPANVRPRLGLGLGSVGVEWVGTSSGFMLRISAIEA